MEYRRLGRSGFNVPVLSFGTGTFGGKGKLFAAWGTTDTAEARRLLDICLDAGVSMFDTADVYSAGESERILGEAMKGKRDRSLVSTKATFRSGEGINDVGSSRQHLLATVDAQLKRLQTDYIDLFQLHGYDAMTPPEEVLSTLDTLVRAGKIRYVGVSNFSGWHLMKALSVADKYGYPRYVANQTYYSLIGREYEWELMPLGLEEGIGAVVWSPLGWGRLTGKIRRGTCIPKESRLHGSAEDGPQVDDEYLFKVVDALDAVAKETGKTHPADRAQLAAAAADSVDRRHRRAQRGAAEAESRRRRLEPHQGAGGEARCGQRATADLSLLAPAPHVHRAQPATSVTGHANGKRSDGAPFLLPGRAASRLESWGGAIVRPRQAVRVCASAGTGTFRR